MPAVPELHAMGPLSSSHEVGHDLTQRFLKPQRVNTRNKKSSSLHALRKKLRGAWQVDSAKIHKNSTSHAFALPQKPSRITPLRPNDTSAHPANLISALPVG